MTPVKKESKEKAIQPDAQRGGLDRGGLGRMNLRRTESRKDDLLDMATPSPVSAGAIDKIIDLAFNPSRDKLREVTVIDRMQGRLFPQADMVITARAYILEIAYFRQDSRAYQSRFRKTHPVLPDLLDEFLFRTAQWQKSVSGMNLKEATNLAMAETERMRDDEGPRDSDDWPGDK